MSRTMTIYLDGTDTPREDRVSFALIPTDAVTGAIVPTGVTARVKGLSARAVRNLSGMLVFLNLPDPVDYDVEVDAREAGYFGPTSFHFPANPDDKKARRLHAALEPRPDFPFASGTTVIRGTVVDGADPVADALIACRPPGSPADFEVRSAPSGAFALAVRLAPPADFDTGKKVPVTIKMSKDGKSRALDRELRAGRSHSFLKPVDLAGNEVPDFFTI